MEFVNECNVEPLEGVLTTILGEEITVQPVLLPSRSHCYNMHADEQFLGSLIASNGRVRVEASMYITDKLMKYGPRIKAAINECWIKWV